jgi:chromosome segregation ATPase
MIYDLMCIFVVFRLRLHSRSLVGEIAQLRADLGSFQKTRPLREQERDNRLAERERLRDQLHNNENEQSQGAFSESERVRQVRKEFEQQRDDLSQRLQLRSRDLDSQRTVLHQRSQDLEQEYNVSFMQPCNFSTH